MQAIQRVERGTDLWRWYWYSYGEKFYAFAVTEAYPLKTDASFPEPGSKLEWTEDEEGEFWLTGENGTKMIIEQEMANIERQNGDAICCFIAAAHAELMKEHIIANQET